MSNQINLDLSDLNYRELQAKAKLWELPGNFKHKILIEVIKARQAGDEARVQCIINAQRDERAKKRALKIPTKYMITRSSSDSAFKPFKKLGRPKKCTTFSTNENNFEFKKADINKSVPISFNNIDNSSADYLKSLLSAPKAISIQQLLKESKVPNAQTKQPGSHLRSFGGRPQPMSQYKYDNRNHIENGVPRSQIFLSGGNIFPTNNNRSYDFGNQQNFLSCAYNNSFEVNTNLPLNNNTPATALFQVETEGNLGIQGWTDNITEISSLIPTTGVSNQNQSRIYLPACQDVWKQDYQPPSVEYWPYPINQSYKQDEYIIPMTPSSDTMSGTEDTTCYQDPMVAYPSAQLIPSTSYLETFDSQMYRPMSVGDYSAIYSADNILTQPESQPDQGVSTVRLVSFVDHQWTYECHSSFSSQAYQSQTYDYPTSRLNTSFPSYQYSTVQNLI